MQHHHWRFVAKLGAFLPPIYRIFTAFLRQGSAALNRGHAKGAWSVEHGVNSDASSSLSVKVGEHAHFRTRFCGLEEHSQPATVNWGATTANLPHFYRFSVVFDCTVSISSSNCALPLQLALRYRLWSPYLPCSCSLGNIII